MLSSLPTDHPWVEPIEHLGEIEAYNDFILKRLHGYVETPLALVIQHDGFPLLHRQRAQPLNHRHIFRSR